MPKTIVSMKSERPRTEKTVFGLLVFFGLLDGAFRWSSLSLMATTCNSGIALGIPLPTTVLWLGIGIFLLLALYRGLSHPILTERLAWVSIFLGGLINSLDRFFYGCVKDYIHWPFFPSFNLADIMLFLGVAFLFSAAFGTSLKTKPYVS